MTKTVPTPIPMHVLVAIPAAKEAGDGESVDDVDAESAKANQSLSERRKQAVKRRDESLARQRVTAGAVVVIEKAHPDHGVGAGQLGRVRSVEGDEAIVVARGSKGMVDIRCAVSDLYWIPQ